MQKSERIKAELSLRVAAEKAGVVWDLKKTKSSKGDWWGSCPIHAEKSSSFHVVEPGAVGGVFKCFGCGAGGSIIDFTMAHLGLDFTDAIRQLASDGGLENDLSETRRAELAARRDKLTKEAEAAAARQAENGHRKALELWSIATRAFPCAVPPISNILPRYLAARGVNLSVLGGVPATLRFIENLEHWGDGKPTHTGPAMIGAIGRTGQLSGVHRTWITPQSRALFDDGTKVPKQWIGRTGDMFGRPCVLSPSTDRVVVGEGIETTLAAYSTYVAAGRVGWSAEAALSRGALTGPTTDATQLWTPRPGTVEVKILGEGSAKDPDGARALYETAQKRLESLGLKVQLIVPFGQWDVDADFADLVLNEVLKG